MAMTMEHGVAPATRGWRLRELWVRQWQARRDRASGGWQVRRRWVAWRRKRLDRQELEQAASLPLYLRKDMGLPLGMPTDGFTNGGRTFFVRGCPDSTLSGWRW